MNMRSKSFVAITAAAVGLTGLTIPSYASPIAKTATASAVDTASVPITDFSSRRRYYRNNNAAAVGAFLAIAGTAAAVAASQQYRRGYGYGYGPRPYYGGYGYAPPPAYGYYGGPRYGYGW